MIEIDRSWLHLVVLFLTLLPLLLPLLLAIWIAVIRQTTKIAECRESSNETTVRMRVKRGQIENAESALLMHYY